MKRGDFELLSFIILIVNYKLKHSKSHIDLFFIIFFDFFSETVLCHHHTFDFFVSFRAGIRTEPAANSCYTVLLQKHFWWAVGFLLTCHHILLSKFILTRISTEELVCKTYHLLLGYKFETRPAGLFRAESQIWQFFILLGATFFKLREAIHVPLIFVWGNVGKKRPLLFFLKLNTFLRYRILCFNTSPLIQGLQKRVMGIRFIEFTCKIFIYFRLSLLSTPIHKPGLFQRWFLRLWLFWDVFFLLFSCSWLWSLSRLRLSHSFFLSQRFNSF